MNTLPIQLCDVCRNPGRCCRGFVLNVYFDNNQPIGPQWEARKKRASRHPDEAAELPFFPVTPKLDSLQPNGDIAWNFQCRNIGANGRCTDYEHRPLTCRDYLAGSDQLCGVMYMPSAVPQP